MYLKTGKKHQSAMLKEYAFTLHRQEKTLQVHGGWQPGTDRLYKPNNH